MQQPYRLGALLMHKQLINQQQLDCALIHQQQHKGMPLGQALISLGIVNQRQINKALNKQSRIRLYAACVAFFMAPFSWCHAGNSDIESLPEYSYTQVADQQFSDEVDFSHFAIDQSSGNLNIVEITTAAAWYLYQGGMDNYEINDVPVKLNLTTDKHNTYKLQLSMSF